MLMRPLSKLLPAVFVVLATSNAFAGIVFNLQGNDGLIEDTDPAFTQTNGGFTMTAEGFLANGTEVGIHQSNWGLSVVNTLDPSGDISNVLGQILPGFASPFGVDGNDPEYIEFRFDRCVTLVNTLFAHIGEFDSFLLTVDGNLVNLGALADFPNNGVLVDFTGLDPTDLTGSQFRFYADSPNSDWTIEQLEVVPEPATFVLWAGLGLGFTVMRRQRRKRQ